MVHEAQAPGADDPYDMLYAQPGVLAKAGVKIAFQTSDASNSRNLPYNAAAAAAACAAAPVAPA